jgi:hypothetical protein
LEPSKKHLTFLVNIKLFYHFKKNLLLKYRKKIV